MVGEMVEYEHVQEGMVGDQMSLVHGQEVVLEMVEIVLLPYGLEAAVVVVDYLQHASYSEVAQVEMLPYVFLYEDDYFYIRRLTLSTLFLKEIIYPQYYHNCYRIVMLIIQAQL